ncbi:MAG: hypothetical protein HY870_18655 [Chloroflexi bacterium]|nr:hypothetical protein [Chloroflexota bacterium]
MNDTRKTRAELIAELTELHRRLSDLATTDVERRQAEQPRAANLALHYELARCERTEKVLRDREERYRNLFENAPIGIYRTTPDGRLLVSSPALMKIIIRLSSAHVALPHLPYALWQRRPPPDQSGLTPIGVSDPILTFVPNRA